MEEKYVYLMNAVPEICALSQQRLKEAGIESKLEDYTQNAFFGIYGASSLLGKKIIVPESKLSQAKELLNITEDQRDTFLFSKSKRLFDKTVKIIAVIFLVILISLYIYSFISTWKNF